MAPFGTRDHIKQKSSFKQKMCSLDMILKFWPPLPTNGSAVTNACLKVGRFSKCYVPVYV